jgi:hypothetical protein
VHGIYHSVPKGTLANNIIYHMPGFGIHTYHDGRGVNSTYDGSLKIMNNTIFKNGRGGYEAETYTGGMHIGTATDATGTGDYYFVANNILYDNYYGIVESSNNTTWGWGNKLRYLNNYVSSTAGLTAPGDLCSPSSLTVNLCLAWTRLYCTGCLVAGNIDTFNVPPPGFVQYMSDGTGNYHLTINSTCVDGGTNTYILNYDFDGAHRPSCPITDIGAYEYQNPGCFP